jgi:DeoR/GlpR family transcriptional regulator of sugar metabolism
MFVLLTKMFKFAIFIQDQSLFNQQSIILNPVLRSVPLLRATMFNQGRDQKILQILQKNTRARVSELSSWLEVSEATIRRDLDRLYELGQVQRFHGGAILVERAAPEQPVVQRMSENAEEKRRIARAAAGLIKEGETVFIGSGTTALEVARNLVNRKDLTVITNAFTVIDVLSQAEGVSLISVGGFLRRSELSFIGHITELSMRELRPQKAIMGIRAASLADGLTNDYLPEVSTDRVIIESAPEVILVADHTKFGKISTALVAPMTAIHKLVTDDQIPPHLVAGLRERGIEVLIV